MKFKVGDRVRVVRDSAVSHAGRSIGQNMTIKGFGEDQLYPYQATNGVCDCTEWRDSELELASPSLDNLQVGDVVVDDDGCKYTVAGVVGRIVFLENEVGHFDITMTIKELKDNDWTVKQPEVTELTLEEVAKLAKVEVSKLRIKD